MKRSEYDRPKHPVGTYTPMQDTWRCSRCKTIYGLRTGWAWIGTGKARRRICKPCDAAMRQYKETGNGSDR